MKGFSVPKNPKLKMSIEYGEFGKVTSIIFTDRKTKDQTFVDELTLFDHSELPSYAINVAFALLCYNGGYTEYQLKQIKRLEE